MNIQSQIDRLSNDFGKMISKHYNEVTMFWELVFKKDSKQTIVLLDDNGKIESIESKKV